VVEQEEAQGDMPSSKKDKTDAVPLLSLENLNTPSGSDWDGRETESINGHGENGRSERDLEERGSGDDLVLGGGSPYPASGAGRGKRRRWFRRGKGGGASRSVRHDVRIMASGTSSDLTIVLIQKGSFSALRPSASRLDGLCCPVLLCDWDSFG